MIVLIPENNLARIILFVVILLLVFFFRNRITGSVSGSKPTDPTSRQTSRGPQHSGGIETLEPTAPDSNVKEKGNGDGSYDLHADPKDADEKKQL